MNHAVSLTKRMFHSHANIGLVMGAFLYLICLTGTLVVFYPQFERWEQPHINEYETLSELSLIRAFKHYDKTTISPDKSVYLVFPTSEVPRAHMSADGKEWWLNQDGSFADEVAHPWTKMIRDLHVYLHLPETFGIMIVSFFGVMLLQILVTGTLAHKRIVKDAFKMRLGGNKQKQHIDLHNRLSVWGLPFHLMIALTGAFFGLVSIVFYISAQAFYHGNEDALISDLYGKDPVIIDAPRLNLLNAYQSYRSIAPHTDPLYLVVQNMGSKQQYIEIAATFPKKLTYSEIYRFDAAGNFLDKQGLATGSAARQTLYSVYRLHFGHYGGITMKFLYLILGSALCYVCVSGINIWLSKRGIEDHINYQWASFVIGVPCAMLFSLLVSLLVQDFAVSSFWLCLISIQALSAQVKNSQLIKARVKDFCIVLLILVISIYHFRFGELASEIYIMVIDMLLLITIFSLWQARKHNWRQYTEEKAL